MSKLLRPICPMLVIGTLWLAAPVAAQDSQRADLLLKNGTIYNGSGEPGFTGDVAIRGERIVAVGEFDAKSADQVYDCQGLVIAPGFIDLHNHSDRQVIAAGTRANVNYLTQGCTTIVTGNCGAGPINVAKYYDRIDAAGCGTNVAHLLPQGALRDEVVGRAQRTAKPAELERMRRLATRAMQEGAWGMSSGLIYVPSSYADTTELSQIAEAVAAHGGLYVSHIRNEGAALLDAVNEAMAIGAGSGARVHISHFKSKGQDAWGLIRQAVKLIEAARSHGQIVTADQYPYTASSTSLEATLMPTWARAGGQKDLVARLDNAEQSSRIRDAIRRSLSTSNDAAGLWIARYKPRQDWVGKNLAQIAESENLSEVDLTIKIARNGGAAIVNFGMSEDDVRFAMQVPWVATASDGRAYLPDETRPHPRSYGTFPRKVGHYALRENVLDTATAIRSATGLPADVLQLEDRGYLRQGAFADVVVFDPDEFIDAATFEAPHQYSRGVRFVFVNGQPAVFRGHPTGALAGRALRHSSTDQNAVESDGN